MVLDQKMTPQKFQYPSPFYCGNFSSEGQNIPLLVEKSNKKPITLRLINHVSGKLEYWIIGIRG